MILKSSPNSVESSGISESKDIVIKQSHHIIEFATSRIYDNIIRAVIRELSTNAYDSHVEAGCPEVPFKVVLPTYDHPEFSVRDYGVGMDHETVMNLFSTLFESSKNQSNDFNGCFGIGSKAPIAYSPMYTVVAYDGEDKKRVYAVVKDDNVLKCNFMGEFEAIDEPKGLEVSVPVMKSDVHTFSYEARTYVYPFFSTYPNIEDYEISGHIVDDYEEFRKTGFRYRVGPRPFNSMFVAVMGNTPYPLDIEVLTKHGILCEPEKYVNYHIPQFTVYLHFDIGELTINPGRERLNYSVTNNTIEAIRTKIQLVKEDIETYFEELFKDVSWFDAEVLFNEKYKKGSRYQAYLRIANDNRKVKFIELNDNEVYSSNRGWNPRSVGVINLRVFSHDQREPKPYYDRKTGYLTSTVRLVTGLKFVSLPPEWRDDMRKVRRVVNATIGDARPAKHLWRVYYIYEEDVVEFCELHNINPDSIRTLDELGSKVPQRQRTVRPPEERRSAETFSAYKYTYRMERQQHKYSTYGEDNQLIFFVQPRLNVIKLNGKEEYFDPNNLSYLARVGYGLLHTDVLFVTETTAAKLRKLPYAHDASEELMGKLREHSRYTQWIRHGAFARLSNANVIKDLAGTQVEYLPSSKLKYILTKIKALHPDEDQHVPFLFIRLFKTEINEYEDVVKAQIKRWEKKYNKEVVKIPKQIQYVFKFLGDADKWSEKIIARQLLSLFLHHNKDKIQKTKAQRKEEYEKIIQAKKINSILNGSRKLEIQETGSAHNENKNQAVSV